MVLGINLLSTKGSQDSPIHIGAVEPWTLSHGFKSIVDSVIIVTNICQMLINKCLFEWDCQVHKVMNQQHFYQVFLVFTTFCCKVKPSIVVYSFFFLLRILATSWSNAVLVLSKVLALVQTYTIPICSATLTALLLSTSLFSSRSILFPTRSRSILETSVFQLTSLIQKLTISKDLMLEMSKTSNMPSTFLQQLGVIVLQRVVPAVSQICTRIEFPSYNFNVFCLYYTPIVVVWFALNYSSTYCVNNELFPTQLYPIISSFTLSSFPLIHYYINRFCQHQNSKNIHHLPHQLTPNTYEYPQFSHHIALDKQIIRLTLVPLGRCNWMVRMMNKALGCVCVNKGIQQVVRICNVSINLTSISSIYNNQPNVQEKCWCPQGNAKKTSQLLLQVQNRSYQEAQGCQRCKFHHQGGVGKDPRRRKDQEQSQRQGGR